MEISSLASEITGYCICITTVFFLILVSYSYRRKAHTVVRKQITKYNERTYIRSSFEKVHFDFFLRLKSAIKPHSISTTNQKYSNQQAN